MLAEALELRDEDRPGFLDRACSLNHSMRREVELLLSSSDKVQSTFLQFSSLRSQMEDSARGTRREADSLIAGQEDADMQFLKAPGTAAIPAPAALPGLFLGKRLGTYHVDELLGVGGMGEVYRAVRDDANIREKW